MQVLSQQSWNQTVRVSGVPLVDPYEFAELWADHIESLMSANRETGEIDLWKAAIRARRKIHLAYRGKITASLVTSALDLLRIHWTKGEELYQLSQQIYNSYSVFARSPTEKIASELLDDLLYHVSEVEWERALHGNPQQVARHVAQQWGAELSTVLKIHCAAGNIPSNILIQTRYATITRLRIIPTPEMLAQVSIATYKATDQRRLVETHNLTYGTEADRRNPIPTWPGKRL